MPAKVVECTLNGVKGFKAEGGKCHIGPAAKEKATAQMQAINISVGRKEGAAWAKKLPVKK